jgi:hypothetical protein
MDPNTNIEEQRALAEQIERFPGDGDVNELAALGERLAELVQALDEWRRRGGYDPYPSNTVTTNEVAHVLGCMGYEDMSAEVLEGWGAEDRWSLPVSE